eukprot:scaffold15263_cov92-Isochrysis_galbana.AAC.2
MSGVLPSSSGSSTSSLLPTFRMLSSSTSIASSSPAAAASCRPVWPSSSSVRDETPPWRRHHRSVSSFCSRIALKYWSLGGTLEAFFGAMRRRRHAMTKTKRK